MESRKRLGLISPILSARLLNQLPSGPIYPLLLLGWWHIDQLDVKNAFLHGDLQETVFMHQPPGFADETKPDFVCRLRKSLYGLKKAPRAWYNRFSNFILSHGFRGSLCDTSLFIYRHGEKIAYLLLYVDDIILTASSKELLQSIINLLSKEFAMTDLSALHHFLGITVQRDSNGLFMSQSQYARDILRRANMTDCKPCATPVDTSSKLSASDGEPLPDGTLYRSLAGALQYLTFTRPDITYAVQQICLFMHSPREPHFAFLERILQYIKGTLDLGLRLSATPSASLTAYSDADWGDVQTPDVPPPDTAFTCATIFSPGLLNANSQSQGPVLKPNTEGWLMLSLKPLGCAISYSSSMSLYDKLLLFTVTMF
ncbi:putative RNA-directed DNA polymerase [Helianthus debilis subsp. tardiflorus]